MCIDKRERTGCFNQSADRFRGSSPADPVRGPRPQALGAFIAVGAVLLAVLILILVVPENPNPRNPTQPNPNPEA